MLVYDAYDIFDHRFSTPILWVGILIARFCWLQIATLQSIELQSTTQAYSITQYGVNC